MGILQWGLTASGERNHPRGSMAGPAKQHPQPQVVTPPHCRCTYATVEKVLHVLQTAAQFCVTGLMLGVPQSFLAKACTLQE